MGDAGPQTPDPLLQNGTTALNDGQSGGDETPPLREVKVLVTGFGVGLPEIPFSCSRVPARAMVCQCLCRVLLRHLVPRDRSEDGELCRARRKKDSELPHC